MPAGQGQGEEQHSLAGVFYAAAAFLIWGLSPVYWIALRTVPALEIIIHRIIWSFLLGLLLVCCRGRWQAFKVAFRQRRTVLILVGTALLMSLNWLVYVWAVNNGRLLPASMGYYIAPLVNVLLGMVFLGERLRWVQALAVLLAAAGVVFLAVARGIVPWVSLILAFCFGFYGLLRKVAPVGSLIGLTMETLLLSIPALIGLCWLAAVERSAFLHQGPRIDMLLAGSGVLTGLPLLLFTLGARRVSLTTLGFIQYIGPTCIFLLGVLVYDEAFAAAQAVTFTLIWAALIIYSTDAVREHRRQARKGGRQGS